ncbi:hypothetical protein MUP01_04705 [Candidatus Bathyarchaeota archaeon]|nr:hypothetical protein [Candidatus Bathyarchaeota archaeon]
MSSTDEILDQNRDVIVNFGLIGYGRLRAIEEIQKLLLTKFRPDPGDRNSGFHLVYNTVTAKRLRIVKHGNSEGDFSVKMEFGGKKE